MGVIDNDIMLTDSSSGANQNNVTPILLALALRSLDIYLKRNAPADDSESRENERAGEESPQANQTLR